jgi:hypothetical protein
MAADKEATEQSVETRGVSLHEVREAKTNQRRTAATIAAIIATAETNSVSSATASLRKSFSHSLVSSPRIAP